MATTPVPPPVRHAAKLTVVRGGKGGGSKFHKQLTATRDQEATRKAADLVMAKNEATPKGNPVLLGAVKGLKMPTEHQYVDKTHAARDMAMWAMVLGIDPKRNG